jgi:hypothetical protein
MHHQKLFSLGVAVASRARRRAILAAAGSRRQAQDKLKDDAKRQALRAEVAELRQENDNVF